MSENVNANNQTSVANGVKASEKMGCGAIIGVILLITAVLLVVFLLVVKPHLEEKGVDVDSFFTQTKEQISGAVGQIKDSASEAADDFKSKSRDVAGKIEDTADDLEEQAGELEDKIKNLEVPSIDSDGSWY